MSAVILQMVRRKRTATADAQAFALQREQIIAGAKGKKGDQGDQGDPGPMPGHEWKGSKLRFERPDGKWGKFIDLKGPKGDAGKAAVISRPAGGGGEFATAFDPASLPLLDGATTLNDYLVIERAGVPYRIKIAALQSIFGRAQVPANVATVNGEPLTVNGEFITVT